MYMYNKNLIKHQFENVKLKANSARRDLGHHPYRHE